MSINTPYLSTPSGSTTVFSDVSISGTLETGAQTVASITASGAISGGALTVSDISLTASDTGVLLTSVTTSSSANSATVGDGELALMESTLTNVTLIYRSGNTTYHWVSSAGSVG